MIKQQNQVSSEWRNKMLLAALFFAQAIPMGLTWLGLPPWLRSHGVSLEAIGATAVCALPWALKFLWAASIERYCMRYGCKPILVILQACSLILFVVLAQVDILSDWVSGIAVLFLLNLICATQNIATDRYAILRGGASGAARVNVARFGGYTVGMLAGGSGLLLVEPSAGWGVFVLLCVTCVLLVGLMALIHREPTFINSTIDNRTISNSKATNKIGLRQFLKTPFAWRLLSIALIFKVSVALSDGMLKSFWVDHGITLDQVSLLTVINIALLGLVGAPLGAWLIGRCRHLEANRGARAIAIVFGLCSSLILMVLGVAIYSRIGIDQAAGVDNLQTLSWLYIVLPALLSVTDGAASLAFFTLFMIWSVGNQPGTTFTLFLCSESLGSILSAMLAGTVAATLGYALHFIVVAILSVLVMFYAWQTIGRYSLNYDSCQQEKRQAMH